MDFKKKTRHRIQRKSKRKQYILKNLYALVEGRERVLDAFESKTFPIKNEDTEFSDKVSDHFNLKILTPKQMRRRLPMSLAQVKAGNTSENLLNEIRQIVYSLYQAKEITKKVYVTI